MPVYSRTIGDKQILQLLQNKYFRVFLIGCGACMNESLALQNGLPITESLEDSKIAPCATAYELRRIANTLMAHGYQVEIQYFNDINGFLCTSEINHQSFEICWTKNPDVILTLCCSAGFDAIKKRFPDIKVIKITQQIGLMMYSFSDQTGKRIIDVEQSKIIYIPHSVIEE